MTDIAPEILEKVNNAFYTAYKNSNVISSALNKIRNGTATYEDAYKYAVEVGNIQSKAYKCIDSDQLPGGKMYFNIADKVISPTLKADFDLVSKYTADVISESNAVAGISLKPVVAPLDNDRVKGFVDRISSELFDDIAWILDEPVKVFTQSVVDDSIKSNAEFHNSVGIKAKVVRVSDGGCCEFCQNLAGEYTYPGVPGEVFSRHDRCRCTITYSGKKLRVNMHSFL